MTTQQWTAFTSFRDELRQKCSEWSRRLPNLRELQKNAALAAGTPAYPFETPVVYNTDLDKITKEDDIRLIVIGDNPGKDEQLLANQRYLCGQAGKIAEGYFRRNPELGVDFRRNVIILNKTPIHSAKTNQLKKMIKDGGQEFKLLLDETQVWMAERTAQLHKELIEGCETGSVRPELWLVGYAELKDKGIFTGYRDSLKGAYGQPEWDDVYVFQHFSMNRFSIDLGEFLEGNKKLPLGEAVHRLGKIHKEEIFG